MKTLKINKNPSKWINLYLLKFQIAALFQTTLFMTHLTNNNNNINNNNNKFTISNLSIIHISTPTIITMIKNIITPTITNTLNIRILRFLIITINSTNFNNKDILKTNNTNIWIMTISINKIIITIINKMSFTTILTPNNLKMKLIMPLICQIK